MKLGLTEAGVRLIWGPLNTGFTLYRKGQEHCNLQTEDTLFYK